MGIKWTQDEIKYLLENYHNTFNRELSEKLKRSESSIYVKANKLGLHKSESHKSKCISKRNKMVGRDLTYETLLSIAKKYKTRGEFQKNDPSAYSASRRLKIIDEICSHMVSKSFSIPQIILKNLLIKLYKTDNILFNDRQTIKPYEIDVYLPDYKIGFEYNGKKWHSDNPRDSIKVGICEKNGIRLIVISERSRDYINDIKKQLIENIGNLVIDITPEMILSMEVEDPYKDVYIIDDLHKIAKSYDNFKIFYKNEQSVYKKISKLKLLDEYTSHMCCRRMKRELTEVTDKISKFRTLNDLIKQDYGTYLFIMKNKLNYLLEHLKKR
jgi:DNA-directed RNA polymerase subunit N (RpoN/RPB10)